jgi:hypothetical protein
MTQDWHHPDWWNDFIGARISSEQIATFLRAAQHFAPSVDACLRVLVQDLGPSTANAFARLDVAGASVDVLVALLRGRGALEAVMDGLAGPLVDAEVGENGNWVRLWCLVAQIILRAEAEVPDAQAAGPYVVRELKATAFSLWGGASAETELLRRGHSQAGPSFRAWEYRIRAALLPDEASLKTLITDLAKRARRRLPPGDPFVSEARQRPAKDLWGPTHETIVKEIPLPVGPEALLESLRRALSRDGWHNMVQKIADDVQEEAHKGRPTIRYECRQCGNTWGGQRKGRGCPKCAATGDEAIRRVPLHSVSLDETQRDVPDVSE